MLWRAGGGSMFGPVSYLLAVDRRMQSCGVGLRALSLKSSGLTPKTSLVTHWGCYFGQAQEHQFLQLLQRNNGSNGIGVSEAEM